MRKKLTNRDKEIIEIILNYHTEHGYMPSYREIGELAGMTSSASIARHMDKFFDMGILETDLPDYTPPRGYRIARDYEHKAMA